MKKPNGTKYIDVFAFSGIGLIAGGAWFIYPPATPIIIGCGLLGFAMLAIASKIFLGTRK